MSEHTRRLSDHEKITLKGERPPGVVGEMNPERFLERQRQWREEGSLEEEERVWERLDKILPK